MTVPKTLLEHAGVTLQPARLQQAALVVIDHQREYVDGKLPLRDVGAAVAAIGRLLAEARHAGAPIFHVAQNGKPGAALFDPKGPMSEFIPCAGPLPDETIVVKSLPNAFARTDLDARIKATGRSELVLAGFMTHMCVSATARAALDLGYRATVAADATATRDLPDGAGGMIAADTVQRVALAELADRFAKVVPRLDPGQ